MADFIIVIGGNDQVRRVERIETPSFIQTARDAKTIWGIVQAIRNRSISGIVAGPVSYLMAAAAIDVSTDLTPEQKVDALRTLRTYSPGDTVSEIFDFQLQSLGDAAISAAASAEFAKLLIPFKDP